MRFGAHVSTSGGIANAVDRALEMGAECLQIFVSAPQQWREPSHPEEQVRRFVEGCRAHGLGPNYLHAIYLLNLATPQEDTYLKSIHSLISYLQWAKRLEAQGVIFHLGSAGSGSYQEAEDRFVAAMERVLVEAPQGVFVVLETAAGQGATVGRTFPEIGAILRRLGGAEALRVCLDTAHVFAAGYDWRVPGGVERIVEEFDREIGLERLVVVHANDSKAPLGSNVDRHENIGMGQIGGEAFRAILHHPAFRELPFILEVPGFDGKGPDRQNLEILRRLAA
jgi:deoxyribonuclease-4